MYRFHTTAKLEKIREAQELYRDIKGEFAKTFEDLSYTLQNDSIPFIKLDADPTDPTNEEKFVRTITYSPAIDAAREKATAMGLSGEAMELTTGQETLKTMTIFPAILIVLFIILYFWMKNKKPEGAAIAAGH